MLFNSYEFVFLFLPSAILVYFVIARFHCTELARVSLVIASLAFYSYWDVNYLPLLLSSILLNYWFGTRIQKYQNLSTTCAGIGLNLMLLAYFKYAAFFVHSINVAVGTSFTEPRITLPLGISFFTFTQIAYLVDAYRGETKHYRFIDYCLFVTIFPHLIAGPILYHKDIIPQFSRLRNFVLSHKNMALGISMFAMGLFKKVLIADTLAPYVNAVFNNCDAATFIEAWVGALGYTLQLYFDFSGYSEMAIGLGLMFNIRLPVNFDSPYKSLSIIDFWRRWHITLSTFLKFYLYIPLGGNRKGPRKRMRNLFVTMLLGGLWHGAGWTYVLWGALHGAYLMINHGWRKLNVKMPESLAWLITFSSVVLAWVFFRAESFHAAFALLKSMIGLNGIMLPSKLYESIPFVHSFALFTPGDFEVLLADRKRLILIPILLLVCIRLPNTRELMASFFEPNLKWACVVGLVLLICFMNFMKVTEFLYFQF